MKTTLSALVKGLQTSASKHSPEILTGVGITGMLTTTVLAVGATPKALGLIEEEKRARIAPELDITPTEVIKVTWKCYIPAAITCGLSMFCLVGANSVNARRNAALAAAYTLSESALKTYREKVIEVIGEKKEQAVRDSVAKDNLAQNPVHSREIIITGKGSTRCYDVLSGRYFDSDIDTIKKAVNEINKNMLDEMYISLNDFYYEIGLDSTKLGDDLGWNVRDGLVELNFSSNLASDGTPCLVLDYTVAPKYDFY